MIKIKYIGFILYYISQNFMTVHREETESYHVNVTFTLRIDLMRESVYFEV